MEVLKTIVSVAGAYGIFLVVAYLLARVFFPLIETEEDIRKPRRARSREPRRLVSR